MDEKTPVSQIDRQAFADALYQARKTCTAIAPLVSDAPSLTVKDAYAIQDINVRRSVADGAQIVGRKIGLTSKSVQKQLGVDEPDFGVLFDKCRVMPGGVVETKQLLQPMVEVEIAFVMAKPIDQVGLDLDQVAVAVDHASAAIEIVDSAIADWKISLVDTVADNASSGLFVLGDDRRKLDAIDLDLGGMELTNRNQQVSVGVAAACLGNPLHAVKWLAEKMIELERPLDAGDIVLSGALGPMVPAVAGDEFIARVQGFEPLELVFR